MIGAIAGATWFPRRPTFLVGCGRSGTTILGTALAQHPALLYLNEPRDIWIRCVPEADIWSPRAGLRCGRLVLTPQAATRRRRRALRVQFCRRMLRAGRRHVMEKLPINSFRLPFIRAAFPDAIFLHIVRDGIEVASSIERFCANGPWYGADDYKWRQLVAYAEADARYRGLAALCETDFERGLLEWRLSVEAALGYLGTLPPRDQLTVHYEQLLADAPSLLDRIQVFIGLAPADAVRRYAAANIRRQSPSPRADRLSPRAAAIVGDLAAHPGAYARSTPALA